MGRVSARCEGGLTRIGTSFNGCRLTAWHGRFGSGGTRKQCGYECPRERFNCSNRQRLVVLDGETIAQRIVEIDRPCGGATIGRGAGDTDAPRAVRTQWFLPQQFAVERDTRR